MNNLEQRVIRRARESFLFFFSLLPPLLLDLTLPCVESKTLPCVQSRRLCVCWQDVHMPKAVILSLFLCPKARCCCPVPKQLVIVVRPERKLLFLLRVALLLFLSIGWLLLFLSNRNFSLSMSRGGCCCCPTRSCCCGSVKRKVVILCVPEGVVVRFVRREVIDFV